MGAALLALIVAYAWWQSPTPPPPVVPVSKVILLPDANGKVGTLVVKAVKPDGNAQGATQGETTRSNATPAADVVLNTAYASATVNSVGGTSTASDDAAATRERFGAVLAARPPAPRSFVVYFETGPAVEFIAAAGAVLDDLRAFLLVHPAPEITVIGHTDRVGTVASNDTLSVNRALAVRDFLMAAGLKANSIEFTGRGEREPAVPTSDEVAEAKNRRVEISVR